MHLQLPTRPYPYPASLPPPAPPLPTPASTRIQPYKFRILLSRSAPSAPSLPLFLQPVCPTALHAAHPLQSCCSPLTPSRLHILPRLWPLLHRTPLHRLPRPPPAKTVPPYPAPAQFSPPPKHFTPSHTALSPASQHCKALQLQAYPTPEPPLPPEPPHRPKLLSPALPQPCTALPALALTALP